MPDNFDAATFSASVMSDPLVRDTWHRKYRDVNYDGTSAEATVADTRARVVRGVYANDPDEAAQAEALEFVQRGLLVPAGRVNAGAGLDRMVTLINCFVSETVQDSMPGIQRMISRAALTMQQGGGIGTDFSTIRPRGAAARSTHAVASGVIPFMDQQDAMCQTIVSGGSRRGAMMGTLRDDHPDLWNPDQFETTTRHDGPEVLRVPSFISAKRQRGRLTQFNISVLISDKFMKAVQNNELWNLGHHCPPADGSYVGVFDKPFPYDKYKEDNNVFVGLETPQEPKQVLEIKKGEMRRWYVYRTVPARQIWEDIMRSTYTYAEPGVIFIDQVNARNNLSYCEGIRTTNPCGEQPLPPHGICCLSSVNLAFLVSEPFTHRARFEWELFRKVVCCGIRFLDNVLDVTRYPLEAQRVEAMAKRRIGLGITGFGDALLQLRVRYGTDQSVRLAQDVSRVLQGESYAASAELAKERGSFPALVLNAFMRSPNVKKLSASTQNLISKYGTRNGVLNTIAPNGTISMYVGNVSSGHEPVFSFEKTSRKVRMDDGTLQTYESVPYGLRLYEACGGNVSDLPAYFVGAMDITPAEHLRVHAAWQEHIDSSISKTINCPTDMNYEDFKGIYTSSYDMGCKGCTTYRYDPAAGRGSVLSVEQPAPTLHVEQPEITLADTASFKTQPVTVAPRPPVLSGRTYKIKWPATGLNWYVNVTNENGVPVEVFITSADAAAQEWVVALSRTVTAVLRRGGDVRFLVDQLTEVCSATGGSFLSDQGRFRPSIVAAIGGVLEQEFRTLGLYGELVEPVQVLDEPVHSPLAEVATSGMAQPCPECHATTLVRNGGCKQCLTCGYNSCG